jgi:uncharacterized protein
MNDTIAHNELPGQRFGPPGIYIRHGDRPVDTAPAWVSSVPVFIGLTRLNENRTTRREYPSAVLTQWDASLLTQTVAPVEDSFLLPTVHGFFANGGNKCLVIGVSAQSGTKGMLDVLEAGGMLEDRSDIDLLCLPDVMLRPGKGDDPYSVQTAALRHCERMGDRFAILDAPRPSRAAGEDLIKEIQGTVERLRSNCGALYFPWIVPGRTDDVLDTAPEPGAMEWRRRAPIRSEPAEETLGYIPPCGHIAGLYARTEALLGPQQSPANALLQNAVDVWVHLDDDTHARLNDAGVNCLRSRCASGIEVGGARTLSNLGRLPFVASARVYLGFRRWLGVGMRDLVFEPNDETLRGRVRRRLESRCQFLLQAGALAGASPSEAYFVKCDDETNGIEARELGRVVAHVGLALSVPAEYIVIYVEHDPGGTGPGGFS